LNITIIYGSGSKGSTYNCVQLFKNALQKQSNCCFTEFSLPRDMPHFCTGCFNCFMKGEDKCPHYQSVKPIVDALQNADGIILSSPVYACDVTGAMKALFDHLCYIWMPHRPLEEMFSKAAFVISTTAGMGTKTANKTMAKSLRFWGVKRISGYGTAVAALCWEDVNEPKKEKIKKALEQKAKTFYQTVSKRNKLIPRIFTRFIFTLMKGMITGYEDGNRDKEYWRGKGWFGKKTPFK
jgi:multimeric flavodoxin WrbA